MTRPLRVLSLGAGVQSTALLMLAAEGRLDIDVAVFADTQWEPKSVYGHLWGVVERYGDQLPPVIVTTAGDLRADAIGEGRRVSLPFYTRRPDGGRGKAPKQCSVEYKIAPVRRVARQFGGGPGKKHRPVRMLLGISWDEIERMSQSDVGYITHDYPLIDMRWTRQDCTYYLQTRWDIDAPRSACIGCPNSGWSRWRNISDEELDDAADAEARLQAGTAMRNRPYLNELCIPIREVVASLRAQGSFFDPADPRERDQSCTVGCAT